MPDGTTTYREAQYTSNGLPTQILDHWVNAGTNCSRSNLFWYSGNGVDLITVTNALGIQVVSNLFNTHHQVLTNYDALNEMTVYTYDPSSSFLTGISYPSGLTTSFTYNNSKRLQQASDQPLGRTQGFSWNVDGTLDVWTNWLGLVTTHYWDNLHRPTGVLYPDGTTTTNLYSLTGGVTYPNSTGSTNILDLTASKDRLSNWTYYAYDPLRRPTGVTNGNGVIARYGYCSCGVLTFATNAFGAAAQATNRYVYDDQSRLTQTTFPDGSVLNYSYDALGRVIAVSDALNSFSKNYDNLNRLTSVTNAYGAVWQGVYDVADRSIQTTDANNVTVNYNFDGLNRLLSRVWAADGISETFVYATNGLLLYTNRDNQPTQYGRDAAMRLTSETNALSQVTQFAYDAANDVTNLLDALSHKTSWIFNQYGWLTSKLDNNSNSIVKYTYDADEHLTNRWLAATNNTGYSYDNVGNLMNITYSNAAPVTISYAYDALNRLTNMSDPTGTTTRTYTGTGQLLTEAETGTGWTNNTVSSSYSQGHRIGLSVAQPVGSWGQTNTYDAAWRLQTVASSVGTFRYGYEAAASALVQSIALPNSALITNSYDGLARLGFTEVMNQWGHVLDGYTYAYDHLGLRTGIMRNFGIGYNNVAATTMPLAKLNLGTAARLAGPPD